MLQYLPERKKNSWKPFVFLLGGVVGGGGGGGVWVGAGVKKGSNLPLQLLPT